MNYELGEELEQTREAIELPPEVELLENPEPAREAAEPRFETRRLGEGLELDSISREVTEPKEISPFRYSEAYVDEEGNYHPQQISGVYENALEDPEVSELARDLKEWSLQEQPMSCAVACQRMCINARTDADVTETELREYGMERGIYSETQGTMNGHRGLLAEPYGFGCEQRFDSETVETLAELKAQGAGLIVSVDSSILMRPDLPKPCATDHSVEVIGFDYSDREKPKILINDPGRYDGRGAAYPAELFERAAGAQPGGGFHAVTVLYPKEENR